MITVNKPVLGKKDVTILDVTKKGDDSRFTITLEMQVKGTERTFKDVLFYDVENTSRVSVIPAIIRALAEQTDLDEKKYITDNEETISYDIDKVLSHVKGKDITVERTAVISERNGQTYYNVSYRPEINEEGVEL